MKHYKRESFLMVDISIGIVWFLIEVWYSKVTCHFSCYVYIHCSVFRTDTVVHDQKVTKFPVYNQKNTVFGFNEPLIPVQFLK